MPNKQAVTQAQLKRAILAVQSVGQTISGVRVRPDGSADVLVGDGSEVSLTSQDDLDAAELAEWRKSHGY